MVISMRIAIVALALAACGSDSKTKSDSPAGSAVQAVTCPPAPAATVTVNSGGTAYVPTSTSIAPGGIVRFVITAAHDVTSATPGLAVGLGGNTVCIQFPDPGTYNFHCSVHGFQGTVTVQ